jgi:hypothetical protein
MISGKRRVKSLPGRLQRFHLCAVLAGDDAKSIVVDFVQPCAAGRQRVRFGGEHGATKPAGRIGIRNIAGLG